MSDISINGSALGTTLQAILTSEDIQPGSDASYQLCKQIYLYHPLGSKMVHQPIDVAQSQGREISIPDSPEDLVKEAYLREWKAIKADEYIANTYAVSRIYGAASIVYGVEGFETNQLIDPFDLVDKKIFFNVLDPLNTAGSLVLNQDPNAPDFQKAKEIRCGDKAYHPSRSCIIFNGYPIYIAYTESAFGYVGRSVYQRALYPLKSYINSMVTDDMVTTKAGVLIAKMKQQGSVIDGLMAKFQGIKRNLLKESKTNNVLSIGTEEDIETLNMQNADTAMSTARKNILENIAAAADMPASMINSETFVEGFGEGTEDAKKEARYVDGIRIKMQPLYEFFDRIVQHRAWTPAFYATIQNQFPDQYGNLDYTTAFYKWQNSFCAKWNSLLTEPDSEKAKAEDVRLNSILTMIEKLSPLLDPINRAILVEWAADNFNDQKMLFQNPLTFDYEALKEYEPQPEGEGNDEFLSNN